MKKTTIVFGLLFASVVAFAELANQSQIGSGSFSSDGTIQMLGNLNFGGYKGVNLAAPTADTDAATKKYADDLSSTAVPTTRTITVNGVTGTLASNVTFTVSDVDTLQSVMARGASTSNTIASTAAVPLTWGGTNTFQARTGTIGGTNSIYWTVSGTNYHLRLQ